MKKQINIILITLLMSLGLSSCSSNNKPHIVKTHQKHISKMWGIYNFVSPIGNSTKKKFVTNIDYIKGYILNPFSSEYTPDTIPAQLKVYIDENEKISFKAIPLNSDILSSIDEGIYSMNVTDKNGYDFLLTAIVYSGPDDRMFLRDEGTDDGDFYSINAACSSDAMYKILCKGGKITIKIEFFRDIAKDFNSCFIIKDANHFKEIFDKIRKDD